MGRVVKIVMVTYEQWNTAIISYFFENSERGGIVFLHTTPETLLEIAEQEGFNVDDAEESLKEAVRKKVLFANKVELYKIRPIDLQEDQPEKEPTQVAFLALTVVAASKMETLDYYKPLNELFFDDPDRGRWKQNDLENIEKLWKDLQNWVEYQHGIELHLTLGPPNQRFVWYPKSQCLISKYDEYKLHAIFLEAKLNPGAYLAEKQLLDILLSSRYFQNLSVKIKRPIQQQNTAEIRLILGQIQLLLENWDGKAQERTISRIAKRHKSYTIEVQLKFNPFRSEDIEQIRYWFRCGRSTQINFKPNALNVESLQSDDSKWFEPFVVDADISSLQVLQNSIEIKSEETRPLTYQLKPSDIWVFQIDSEPDDGWFSQGNLLLHEVHRIVFRKEQNFRVTSILQHVCEPFTPPKSICVGGEETDWQYVEVKPTVLCKTPILGYRITTSDKISFVGGLPLGRRKNLYFDFCLPTIVVPNLYADSDKMFYINDQPTEVPNDRKIVLPDKLGSRKYKLSYLDFHTTLSIISPNRSTEHEKQTLTINIDPNAKKLPIFKDCKITEISEESDVWLAGAKFFGADIPFPNENIESLSMPPAEIISLVVKIAIELKQENTSPPEWFHKVINNLNQDMALQALVKKKLNDYSETALSYHDLCSLGGD